MEQKTRLRGRPPVQFKRENRIEVNVTLSLREKIEEAANLEYKSLSQFMVDAVVEKLNRIQK